MAFLVIESSHSRSAHRGIEYKTLFSESDIVVIAAPVSTTRPDSATFPGPEATKFVEQHTMFKVEHVLKGRKRTNLLTLVHYVCGPPAAVAFEEFIEKYTEGFDEIMLKK